MSRTRLLEDYDCFLLDLDGVLYRGDNTIAGAPETIDQIRSAGRRPIFITNNSSRTPDQVAANLSTLGISADPAEVVTSALATASLLRQRGIDSAFVIGEDGIREALSGAGVRVTDGRPERIDAVVVGFDSSVDYEKLRTASVLVERGAVLVATNGDGSYPAPDGLWPGAGALLAVITTTTGAAPEIVGKPNAPLFRLALERAEGGRPLVVGDRLDTDVAGASALGWDSLLVLTGVSTRSDMVRSEGLPTYLGRSVSTLQSPGIRVRLARDQDLPGVERLLDEAGLDRDGMAERLRETLVAECSGAAIGTASLEIFGTTGHLRSVTVSKLHRGSLTGALLVAHAIQRARDRGCAEVYAVTETAESFFSGLGFLVIGSRARLPAAIAQTPLIRERCRDNATALRLEL